MYATVYVDKEAKREEKKVDKLISELYARLCDETRAPDAERFTCRSPTMRAWTVP